MRIHMQIDDDDPTHQPTSSPTPVETSNGGAAPLTSESDTPEAAGDAINAGPPPAYLVDALGDTPSGTGPSTEAFDGGAAPAVDG